MDDQIRIKNLEVYSNQGEQRDGTKPGQKFFLDAVLYTDTRAAGFSDEMQKSVDYNAVCYFASEYLKRHSFKLMESMAELLAAEILMEIPQVDRVDIEIKKPGTSIQAPVESVSVAISRGWHTVDLSIASGMGDRRTNLMDAVRALEANPRNRRVRRSSVTEPQPYGEAGQQSYFNVAVEMQTLYTPRELLEYLRELEDKAGPGQRDRPGLRVLDMDIVFYDDIVMGESDLVIPHPDMQNRMSVLGPLSEICPGKLHPVFNKSVMRMRRELERRQQEQKQSR